MIRISEVTPESAMSVDLEDFWLEELEKAPNLSYRLTIFLELRKSLPARWFASFIRQGRFLKWVEDCNCQMQKWDAQGRPPSEETVSAFMKLTAGMTYEDVLRQVLEEALSKPTLRKTRYEAKREIYFKKQAVSKKVYRVKKSLEDTGFPIKHKTKVLRQYAEFIEKINRLATMKDNLENQKLMASLPGS